MRGELRTRQVPRHRCANTSAGLEKMEMTVTQTEQVIKTDCIIRGGKRYARYRLEVA